jgi:RNA-binding protein
MILTGKQKRFLRAKAHVLKPVVHVGKDAATPALVKEVKRQLDVHELIKVKALEADSRDVLFASLCTELGASLVQTVGKIGVLYKARVKDSKIVLPRQSQVLKS